MAGFFSIFAGIYFLDVATKMLVRRSLSLGQEIKLLPIFSLTHVENTGIAFGMFQGQNTLFIGVGVLLSAILIWMAYQARKEGPMLPLVFGVILAGAWGNLTDRILFGRVTDFLDFYAGQYHWPAFNVADSAICVGAGLLLLQNFKKKG